MPDAAWSAPFADAGLVTDVAAGDLDGDGDDDLALATEWGPVRVFLNDGAGRFTEETDRLGLRQHTGWWNGVEIADLDGDGRPDLVATNYGWNSAFERPKRPLRLYYGDLDANGIVEPMLARYDAGRGDYVPVPGLKPLSRALPGVRRRIRSFGDYAAASMTDVFGPALSRLPVLEAATLASTVFLNRGGRFEAQPLPGEAQWTTAFTPAVADFDGDGVPDLFLAQNFFATNDELARQDAGRGLLLRGDGAGGFTPVEGHRAGIVLYGEQRGAATADVDGDGRPDLVVGQNDGPTMLYLNRGGAGS